MSDFLISNRPHLLHGGDYNPDQWLHSPDIFEEDLQFFDKTGCNTFSVGIFAWSRLEPAEGTYDFQWLDLILDRLASARKNVLLATPSGAKPFWLAGKYPETRRVNRQGLREPTGGRHNHCWSSPVYREKVLAINTALAGRYHAHPAVKMWHVSNEYGGECLCELCIEEFRRWLERRYGPLDAVNRAYWSDFWAHRFSSWSQINPRDENLDGLSLDWKRFVSWQVSNFYQWEAAPLRRAPTKIPVITNLMGFSEQTNYHELAAHLDIVADDSYPSYNAEDPQISSHAAKMGMRFDMLRCLKGQPKPWFLMESCIDGCSVWGPLHLKPPGLHHLEMIQALAHGAEGTLYFQWRKGRGGMEKYHGAVIHHTHPEQTRAFKEVQALGHRYEKLSCILGSLNCAKVALIVDWESRWAYQTSHGLPRCQEPYALVDHAEQIYAAFWRRGITVDVLAADHDFSKYRILVLPRLYQLKAGMADRIRRFVAKGGVVLATSMLGMVNETNLCWTDGCPGDGLEDVAGLWMEEVGQVSPFGELHVTSVLPNPLNLEGAWPVKDVYSTVHAGTAATLLKYEGMWLTDQPAFTANSYGNGSFYYLAADLEAHGMDAVFDKLIESHSLHTGGLNIHELPPSISWQQRKSAMGSFHFFLNFSPECQTVRGEFAGCRDVETDETFDTEIPLDPWQARVLLR